MTSDDMGPFQGVESALAEGSGFRLAAETQITPMGGAAFWVRREIAASNPPPP